MADYEKKEKSFFLWQILHTHERLTARATMLFMLMLIVHVQVISPPFKQLCGLSMLINVVFADIHVKKK